MDERKYDISEYRAHVQRISDESARDLNVLLYGDSGQAEPFWRRINDYCGRVRDAWLVLTGKADIGYD